jgi:integrase
MSENAKKRRPYGSGSVFKRGKKYWIAYYSNGKLVREAVSLDRDTAEKVLKTRQSDIIRRRFHLPTTQKMRFEEMAKQYLEWSKINKRSWLRDADSLKNLVPFFKVHSLSEITPLMVDQYKEMRKKTVKVSKVSKIEKRPANATVNRELALLKHLFSMAIKWEYVDSNPVKGIKFLKENMKERILTTEEISTLLDEANENLHRIVLTALCTGMRLGEILALKWRDVNLRSGFVQVEHSKNGKMRKVPINSALTEMFRSVNKGEGEYVFMNHGRPIKSIQEAFENALKRGGIKNCRFHDLRHTFATYALYNGADLVSIRDILGHSDIRMTARYAHSTEEMKKRAVESLVPMLSQPQSNSEYSQIIHKQHGVEERGSISYS